MYKVFFADGTTWDGGHYTNSKWFDMPDKEITKIEYSLTEQTLVLEGFESYGHIVGRIDGVNFKFKGIGYVIIMGKWKHKVWQTEFNFIKGLIIKRVVNYGEENNGRQDTSWHNGKWEKNITPKMKPKIQ